MRKWKIWLYAARPQTLPAAFIPVLLGMSTAWFHEVIHIPASLTALFCAVAIQVGTNFANDYFDFIKGADSEDRIGFERATASGKVKPESMLKATKITMLVAFVAGLYLVWIGGWVILLIGVLSLLFGILYTGGPFPLGYNGLGDVFVFIFFGFAAVMGTYYLNTLQWSVIAFWVSVPAGALCVNILVINNLRDIEQDRASGKRTLGVLFGERVLKFEYLLMIISAYAVIPILYINYNFNEAIFLPLLGLPFALMLLKSVWFIIEKQLLNSVLERTAQFMVLFGLLLSIGIVVQPS